jgi:hypothetical protein
MQQTIELKFDAKAIVMIKGRKVFQIEQFVKVNEKGDQALLSLVVPAEHARTKTFKLTVDVEDAPAVEIKTEFNTIDTGMNSFDFEAQTIGKKTKETPNLYEIAWANATRSGRIQLWAATPVEAFKLAGFDKVTDRAYQGIRQIKI